ncbi:MAG: GtrA family protein [Patescibacteria group bacterium]|nr:GtrA family protein [Patescibacteria group bacterium]MDE1988717.1 GtrA family protein [Patescibacteria group bacterium]MDE2218056.1 GtrA family protein [Patescibacteria group bacterium]
MLEKNYQKIHKHFKRLAPPVIYGNAFRHRQIIKYLIAGGTSTSADLLIYYILTYLVGLWYVASSIFSFIIAFWISFSLQKFWTFRDKNTEKMMKQTYLYFFVAIVNLGISTLLIYLFVDHIHIHKFISKVIANAMIAAESFFVYRHFIFAEKDKPEI